ncbi:MAG: Protoheme IX farnesyltransferase [Gammaproteobacteria bacterium]|nr:Protoheme IX farnesyltransferase [Gammaproteobacteria bacterium]
MGETTRALIGVFKLRIGVVIMLSSLAGLAVTPGTGPGAWQTLLFALAVLLSSASAGAFNQFAERDLDARMGRTSRRPFVTGRYQANGYWLAVIGLLLLVSVAAAILATNTIAALYVFLGAFTYGIVYTVWLKRRTWLNIVIGGLSGSFAVLAGAAAVDPTLSPIPVLLAVVLFLWTPPHFWSLAFVYAREYAAAEVPMLPVVAGNKTAARVIFAHTLTLVLVSLLPFYYGLGWIYLTGAMAGGAYFLFTSYKLLRHPDIPHALANFRASLLQLTLLITACVADAWLG